MGREVKKSQKMGDVNNGRPAPKLKYYDFVEKSATSLNVALIFLILRAHCVCVQSEAAGPPKCSK